MSVVVSVSLSLSISLPLPLDSPAAYIKDLFSSVQAEISALENSGRLPASAYEDATMYTTLSPCDMCTGACILYKVKRVVIGENQNFRGGEDYLRSRGKELVVLDNAECKQLMAQFIRDKPELW